MRLSPRSERITDYRENPSQSANDTTAIHGKSVSNFFRGKEDDGLYGYVRTANDVLFNPDGTLERVEREYEQRAESDTDADGQTGLESQVALAQIEQVSEDVREKAETFEEREELLRERFMQAAK